MSFVRIDYASTFLCDNFKETAGKGVVDDSQCSGHTKKTGVNNNNESDTSLHHLRYRGCSDSAVAFTESLTRCGTFRRILDALRSHEQDNNPE